MNLNTPGETEYVSFRKKRVLSRDKISDPILWNAKFCRSRVGKAFLFG
jgi:hypothetical protein